MCSPQSRLEYPNPFGRRRWEKLWRILWEGVVGPAPNDEERKEMGLVSIEHYIPHGPPFWLPWSTPSPFPRTLHTGLCGCSQSSESHLPVTDTCTLNRKMTIRIPSLNMKECRTHRSHWSSYKSQLIREVREAHWLGFASVSQEERLWLLSTSLLATSGEGWGRYVFLGNFTASPAFFSPQQIQCLKITQAQGFLIEGKWVVLICFCIFQNFSFVGNKSSKMHLDSDLLDSSWPV